MNIFYSIAKSAQELAQELGGVLHYGVDAVVVEEKPLGRYNRRPTFKLVTQSVKTGDVVLVHDWSALGRYTYSRQGVEKTLQARGATLAVADADTPLLDRMMRPNNERKDDENTMGRGDDIGGLGLRAIFRSSRGGGSGAAAVAP